MAIETILTLETFLFDYSEKYWRVVAVPGKDKWSSEEPLESPVTYEEKIPNPLAVHEKAAKALVVSIGCRGCNATKSVLSETHVAWRIWRQLP